LSKIDLYSRG